MTKASSMIQAKAFKGLQFIYLSASLEDAVKQMYAQEIGCLLVLGETGLVGILTERDLIRKSLLSPHALSLVKVEEVMNPDPVCVTSHCTLERCMELMSEKRVHYLVVVDQGHLKGILSMGDLVKRQIQDQEHVIQNLVQYITAA